MASYADEVAKVHPIQYLLLDGDQPNANDAHAFSITFRVESMRRPYARNDSRKSCYYSTVLYCSSKELEERIRDPSLATSGRAIVYSTVLYSIQQANVDFRTMLASRFSSLSTVPYPTIQQPLLQVRAKRHFPPFFDAGDG